MRKIAALMASCGILMLANTILAAPASAAIQCNGRLQYNSAANRWIGSPYCADQLIAAVARTHGMNVSGRDVRLKPGIKEEACRFAGSDIRINDLCAGHLSEGADDGGRG